MTVDLTLSVLHFVLIFVLVGVLGTEAGLVHERMDRAGAVERIRSHARAVRARGGCNPGDDAEVVEIRISSCERTKPILYRVPQLVGGDLPHRCDPQQRLKGRRNDI
jgi:hypothetical protein